MDATVRGHPHAKSAIDIACWDILGQATGLPLYVLLGGRYFDEVPLVVIIPIGDPDTMVAAIGERRREGFRTFQMKVGTEPLEDIARVRAAAAAVGTDERLIIDANRGWNSEDALRVLRAIDDVDCLIEQPCGSYEACLTARRHSRHPFLLDELIDGVPELIRAHCDGALDALVIKLAHSGGLTRAAALRDLCVALGLRMRIEDTAGSEIVLAATAHLAQATPPIWLIGAYPFVNEGVCTAEGGPTIENGRMRVSERPGLGLTAKPSVPGAPVLEFG
jgi:cis-L-3-hydroxyproline dehydratase